ncbi:MAG: fatty acid desaturase [Nitrobacter sp.]|jgi:omega-6 fatty acid desaturase (delta-12 desaturase)|uniref:fatty acid desaturase n=1 Tax=Nitrobacter sp. TaxID=29420 RepID=UPI00387DEB95
MDQHAINIHTTSDSRALAQALARYREPDSARSVFEVVITAAPFALLWVLIWAALDAGYWIGLLLAVPAAGLLVRLFMIQHDCGHGSFFRHRLTNDWVGRIIGVLTLTPYDVWRRAHTLHHAGSGNLDRRGIGDIDTLTAREFLALPKGRRLLYRLYRHPIVMFGIGPAYLFILQHRLPMGLMRSGWQPWISAMATNVAIAVLAATLIWLVGVGPFLLVQLPITLLAASIGVWLFYVQHQFEDTFWAHDERWNFHEAGLHGSSHYDLPIVLRWFTANIGVHHVHHLCSRIPYYRLPQVLRDHPQLAAVGRLTLFQSLRCVRKVLWDEDQQKLVSFREMASVRPPASPYFLGTSRLSEVQSALRFISTERNNDTER